MPRYPYSVGYDPPAAVIPLEMRHPEGSDAVQIVALVDTGADVTIVPQSIAVELGLPVVSNAIISAFEGTARTVRMRAVDVRVAGHRFVIEAASYGREAIAGRDLLNRLIVKLDGPGMTLDVRGGLRK
jgi:predicted aspartyl protease